jgi:hypothetical protein
MSDKERVLKHFNPMKLREKYSINSVNNRLLNKKNNYSSFWLDDGWDTNTTSIFDEELDKPKVDVIGLSSYRRAVSNFVNIVTGDSSIKVDFHTTGDSYTDGKKVVISAKLDDKLFDSSVGLALHEGSHILLSDFDFLRNLKFNIPKEYIERAWTKGYSETDALVQIKNLLNYVEDRRIDHYIFTTSPGYKGYYHSMYSKYFHFKAIDKGLKSSEYTDETLESYMFRIINLTNTNTNLNALNGLRDIWKVLDLKNISRVKSSEEAFRVALNIYDIVLNNLEDGIESVDDETGEISTRPASGDKSEEENESGTGEGEGGTGSGNSETMSDEDFKDLLDSLENDELSSGSSGGGKSIDIKLPVENKSTDKSGIDTGKETKKVELTEAQKRSLNKAIEKQNKFLDGDLTKKKVTKKILNELKTVEEAGMSYKEVAKDLTNHYTGKATPTKCILINNLTKSLIENSDIGILTSAPYGYWREDEDIDGFVEKGIRLGTILGRKLQVRGESRETKWTRKDSGRIDKRLIAELGFGNERIFNTTFVESYSDAFLHISVDASGSMSGDKWDNTMTSVVAICKAASMISNVDVVVSIRSTSWSSIRNDEKPLILIAYDSRKDSFSKVKNYFKHIRCAGTTPEGLCFEAILDDIIPTSKDRDSYFLNFSDGMPMFGNKEVNYYNETAISHTKKMMKEIKNRGIKVLSYFIGDSSDGVRYHNDFKTMYGKDAEFIDVTSVMSVSKTMNKKFLEKND